MTADEKRRAYQREWRRRDRAANPEKYALAKRQQYGRNRESILEAAKLYQEQNRDLISERKRARYRSQEPAARRDSTLRRLYGISSVDFEIMKAAQGGVCAICSNARPLVVDHDHHTGEVRKLLCNHCNRAIGLMTESPESLVAAAAYLRSFGR